MVAPKSDAPKPVSPVLPSSVRPVGWFKVPHPIWEAASKDGSKPTWQCVYVERAGPDHARLTATDGLILASIEVDAAMPDEFAPALLAPDVLRLAHKTGFEVEVIADQDGGRVFRTPHMAKRGQTDIPPALLAQESVGRYPDWRSFVTLDLYNVAEVQRKHVALNGVLLARLQSALGGVGDNAALAILLPANTDHPCAVVQGANVGMIMPMVARNLSGPTEFAALMERVNAGAPTPF
jgi:hypothetical protein